MAKLGSWISIEWFNKVFAVDLNSSAVMKYSLRYTKLIG